VNVSGWPTLWDTRAGTPVGVLLSTAMRHPTCRV
jgi:hypothetical protein